MNNTSIGERISAVVDELFGYDDDDSYSTPIVPIVIGALLTLILVLAVLVRIQREIAFVIQHFECAFSARRKKNTRKLFIFSVSDSHFY